MSGTRHHFIPRFLQKGFASRLTTKDTYCWTFSIGKEAYQANIKNIGIENLFYSVTSETELDDKITYEEANVYVPLIDRLRTNEFGDHDIEPICEMLAHFEIRGQHLRANANLLFSDSMTAFLDIFSDPIKLSNILTKVIAPESKIFIKALEKAGLSQELFQFMLQSEPDLLAPMQLNITKIITQEIALQRETLPKLLAEAAKNSHIKVLNETIAPKLRVARYANLDFTVVEYPSGDLPLGDSIVIFYIEGDRSYKPFLDKDDHLIEVILPLSSRLYLRGLLRDKEPAAHPDLGLEIARCSQEYFISSMHNARTLQYQKEIGINSHWLDSENIPKIFAEALETALENH